MKSIILIIDYFAKDWPDWFPIFIESCKKNGTIDWLIHTNCSTKIDIPQNVHIHKISEYEYCKKVSETLGIYFFPSWNYKIVDIKPAYGKIWEKEIKNYDFWGYTDIDIIYGNLRHFLTEKFLIRNGLFPPMSGAWLDTLQFLRTVTGLKIYSNEYKIGNIFFPQNYFFFLMKKYLLNQSKLERGIKDFCIRLIFLSKTNIY